MKNKLLVMFLACALLIALALPASAFAATVPGRGGYCQSGGIGGLMCDDDGNFLGKDAFEDKLDKAIEDGSIPSGDKEYYLDMYDFCVGGGVYGGRGCCGRRRF